MEWREPQESLHYPHNVQNLHGLSDADIPTISFPFFYILIGQDLLDGASSVITTKILVMKNL